MATDKETDKRLRRTYGISLEEYNEILAEQNGCCAVCGSPPKSQRLHVDHDHKWKYVKINTSGALGQRVATCLYAGTLVFSMARTKTEAIRKARKDMQRLSIRGLLCPLCNRGLRVYRDNPDFLAKAAAYLRKHQRALNV